MNRPVIVTLLLSMLLAGCGSLAARGQLSEVQSRRPPDVDLGPQIALLEESTILSTSIIGTDGRSHLFATDAKKQLRHIEVLDDAVVKSEGLGLINTDKTPVIDAVEQPSGKLRVLIGDKQYVRAAPGFSWREFEGNRKATWMSSVQPLAFLFPMTTATLSLTSLKSSPRMAAPVHGNGSASSLPR